MNDYEIVDEPTVERGKPRSRLGMLVELIYLIVDVAASIVLVALLVLMFFVPVRLMAFAIVLLILLPEAIIKSAKEADSYFKGPYNHPSARVRAHHAAPLAIRLALLVTQVLFVALTFMGVLH